MGNHFSAIKEKKKRFWHICYLVCGILEVLIAILFAVYIVCTASERNAWKSVGGIFLCLVSISIGVFEIHALIKSRKENKTSQNPSNKTTEAETKGLRRAETTDAYKILLEAKVDAYQICYRRRRLINELVVNNAVYAEKKGLFEPVHTLCAVIDGHKIEAGLDDMNCSFITFDGELVNYKQRFLL